MYHSRDRPDLHDIPIDWVAFATSGEIRRVLELKELRPHQRDAFAAAVGGLAEWGSRGTLLMACGTGTTLTGLRIAEELAGTGGRSAWCCRSP